MEHYTEDKITIIEGPPPTFELMNTEWTRSLGEGAARSEVALTRLRTFNGPALVERCHRAWRHKNTIHLEYRTPEGLHQTAPIIAARNVETDEGDMLLLWVRINLEEHDVSIEWEGEPFDDDDEEPPVTEEEIAEFIARLGDPYDDGTGGLFDDETMEDGYDFDMDDEFLHRFDEDDDPGDEDIVSGEAPDALL